MIGKLTGILDTKSDTSIILDVSGVGYHVFCSQKTLRCLGPLATSWTLFIEMSVREDAIHLYGFLSDEERAWFRLLTTVQGVGNRVGLALLSLADPQVLATAIVRQDKDFIAQAEGVGLKLATRLVTELKDKVTTFLTLKAPPPGEETPEDVVDSQSRSLENTPFIRDALSGLLHLGYRQKEAMQALQAVIMRQEAGESLSVEILIKKALTELAPHPYV